MTRILFITATRIGDAIMNMGVLDHLITAHPDARITVGCSALALGACVEVDVIAKM